MQGPRLSGSISSQQPEEGFKKERRRLAPHLSRLRPTYVGEKLSDETTSPARHAARWWGRMKGDGGGRENEGGVEE